MKKVNLFILGLGLTIACSVNAQNAPTNTSGAATHQASPGQPQRAPGLVTPDHKAQPKPAPVAQRAPGLVTPDHKAPAKPAPAPQRAPGLVTPVHNGAANTQAQPGGKQ
jgi:hypothetical protein